MGVKYIQKLRAADGISWQFDIETPSYSDTPIPVWGVSNGVQIDYSSDSTDNPYEPFIKGTFTLKIYNQGSIDINELQQAGDKDFLLKAFRNGLLWWAGYLKPEDIQWNFITPPAELDLTFQCGLAMLDDIPYVHQDLFGLDGNVSRCPMNYIRQILYVLLDIKLPIRWTNALQCTAFTGDFFTGGVQWSPFNEGFYSYQQGVNGAAQGPAQTCGYILKGFLQATQCRIYQDHGKWIIRRVNEVIQANIHYKEIDATLGVMTVLSGTQSLSRRIGRTGYRFLNENAVITVKPGLKSFKTTYAANIRSNILPNGNFDVLTSDLTVPEILVGNTFLYWGSYAGLLVDSQISLDGQSGYAAELINVTDVEYFTMISAGGTLGTDGLPFDAFTLVKVINFNFMFCALFFPTSGGLIDWSSKPLEIQVILRQGNNIYYLNEFGTWSTVNAFIPIVIDNLAIGDVAQVSFDKFQGIKIPKPVTQPTAGDLCDLQIIFKVKPGQVYEIDNVSITIDNANDVYEVFNDASKNTSTDKVDLDISSSFGGYMLSNFMSSPFKSDDECRFNDAAVYSGTLTGVNSQAVMRFRYKSSQILNTDMYVANGNWGFDEIYSVDTLLGKKFLPLNAKYQIEKAIVSIVAMEARNDNVTLRESFYNSNDNINSN